MKKKIAPKYYSQPLSEKRYEDWFKVANNCYYSWQDILDKKILDLYLKRKKNTSFIIYKTSNNLPVAIFFSRYFEYFRGKFFFKIKLKYLSSHFTGLFVHNDYHNEYKKIVNYLEENIFNNIKKSLSIDYISYTPSPYISLIKPNFIIHQILFKNQIFIKYNVLIVNNLLLETLATINKRTRDYIKSGIKYFDKNNLSFEVNKENISYENFKKLEEYKASQKNIPFLKEQYLDIKDNENYRFFMISDKDNEPFSMAFIRIYKNIATLRFNASSSKGKETLQNKVLLFKIYSYLKDIGIDFFILGDFTDDETLKFFKSSMANQTSINNTFYSFFSFKSKVLNKINLI